MAESHEGHFPSDPYIEKMIDKVTMEDWKEILNTTSDFDVIDTLSRLEKVTKEESVKKLLEEARVAFHGAVRDEKEVKRQKLVVIIHDLLAMAGE